MARRAARPTATLASARPTSTRRLVPERQPGDGRSRPRRRAEQVEEGVDALDPRRDRPPATRSVDEVGPEPARAWCTRCASTRCSRTVRPRNSSGCWNVRARPRQRARLRRGARDVLAAEVTRPAFGAEHARQRRRTACSCPRRSGRPDRRSCPRATSTLTSDSATRPPKRTVTSGGHQTRRGPLTAVGRALRRRAGRAAASRASPARGRSSRRGAAVSAATRGRSTRQTTLRNWSPCMLSAPSGWRATTIAVSPNRSGGTCANERGEVAADDLGEHGEGEARDQAPRRWNGRRGPPGWRATPCRRAWRSSPAARALA